MELRKPGFSGSTLKIIALITMFLDHAGVVVVQRMMNMPGFDHDFWRHMYLPLRYIGRISFPIFCFLLVEGFIYTSNRKKYLSRILWFALISEIPFDLGVTGKWMDFRYQNVFWELALAILVLMCLEIIERKNLSYGVQTVLRLTVIAVFAWGGEVLHLDYGMYGIISIVALYAFRQNKELQLIAGAISFLWEQVAPLAFLLLAFYNGKRGRNIKYAFYVFYPAHFLLLYVVARVIGCQY